jgi:acyl-CoA thioesterase
MDLVGETVAGGRGFYRGRMFDPAGKLIAGIAQESLFRPGVRDRVRRTRT